MTFDPDASHAHDATAPEDPARRGERPPTKARRGPANDDERAAAAAMSQLATKNLGGWSATFVASVAEQVANYGPRLTESQWAHAVRVARENGMIAGEPRQAPITDSPDVQRVRGEIRAGEARLDAILRDPQGDRCLCRDLGGAFGVCGQCALGFGPTGEKRGQGNSVCRAIPWLAERRAWLLDASGRHDDDAAIRADMGLTQPETREVKT